MRLYPRLVSKYGDTIVEYNISKIVPIWPVEDLRPVRKKHGLWNKFKAWFFMNYEEST
jgi:hypothetical protein